MANIKSFPNNQDEYIGAESVMRWHHGRTSGVFGADGNAAVSPVLDAMAVTVSDGTGWISNENADGIAWWIDNEAETGNKLQLTVDMSDAVHPRTDRVVVSWQTTNYVALPEVIILKGKPSARAVAPNLTNDSMVRQISLAAIHIPAGATSIDASMISDERMDASVCGIVTEKVSVDTSVMQAQFDAFYRNSMADFAAYMAEQKAAWEAFFATVTDDIVLPVPAVGDMGKVVAVNDACDGFELKQDNAVIEATVGTAWDGAAAPYTITIPVPGILASDTPHITPVYSGTLDTALAQKEAWEMISDAETGDGTIKFVCFEDKPTAEVPIQIEVNR